MTDKLLGYQHGLRLLICLIVYMFLDRLDIHNGIQVLQDFPLSPCDFSWVSDSVNSKFYQTVR